MVKMKKYTRETASVIFAIVSTIFLPRRRKWAWDEYVRHPRYEARAVDLLGYWCALGCRDRIPMRSGC